MRKWEEEESETKRGDGGKCEARKHDLQSARQGATFSANAEPCARTHFTQTRSDPHSHSHSLSPTFTNTIHRKHTHLLHESNAQIVARAQVRGQNGHDGDRHPLGVQRVPNHGVRASAGGIRGTGGVESARVGKRLLDQGALGGRTVLRGELQLLRHGLCVEPGCHTVMCECRQTKRERGTIEKNHVQWQNQHQTIDTTAGEDGKETTMQTRMHGDSITLNGIPHTVPAHTLRDTKNISKIHKHARTNPHTRTQTRQRTFVSPRPRARSRRLHRRRPPTSAAATFACRTMRGAWRAARRSR